MVGQCVEAPLGCFCPARQRPLRHQLATCNLRLAPTWHLMVTNLIQVKKKKKIKKIKILFNFPSLILFFESLYILTTWGNQRGFSSQSMVHRNTRIEGSRLDHLFLSTLTNSNFSVGFYFQDAMCPSLEQTLALLPPQSLFFFWLSDSPWDRAVADTLDRRWA